MLFIGPRRFSSSASFSELFPFVSTSIQLHIHLNVLCEIERSLHVSLCKRCSIRRAENLSKILFFDNYCSSPSKSASFCPVRRGSIRLCALFVPFCGRVFSFFSQYSACFVSLPSPFIKPRRCVRAWMRLAISFLYPLQVYWSVLAVLVYRYIRRSWTVFDIGVPRSVHAPMCYRTWAKLKN